LLIKVLQLLLLQLRFGLVRIDAQDDCKLLIYFILFILIIYSFCNNRTEFKGAVLTIAAQNGIPIIRGRAYYPETQGAVEKANSIFKARLFTCQAEAGVGLSDWLYFLAEIVLCINTIRPLSLLAYITLFEVWFGRVPYWLTEQVLDIRNRPIALDSDTDDEDNCSTNSEESNFERNTYKDSNANEDTNSNAGYPPETDDEAEGYILTAIEQRIKANNILVAEKIVYKSKRKAILFADGILVTLAIPSKMRLSLEPKRMLCRIIKYIQGRYTLTFKFGRFKGTWTASQLNRIQDLESGVEIPLYWPDNGPTIALTQAVQLSNYRGTVASMHKPNRDAAAQRTKALAVAAKALEVVASLAPPRDKPANQLAQELAQEVAQEVSPEPAPEVPIALGSGPGRELGTRKRKRTAKAVAAATLSAPARSLRSSGSKRQRR
jgi:hypothetical protein